MINTLIPKLRAIILYLKSIKSSRISNVHGAVLPFDKDDANRYLPWIIAVMTSLTAFMLAVGLSFNNLVKESDSELIYRLQVQLPYSQDKDKPKILLKRLNQMTGIENAEIMENNDITVLLEPWLGKQENDISLPLPVIIDVWMEEDATNNNDISSDIVKKELVKDFPDVTVDGYNKWIDDFNRFTSLLQSVAYFLGFCILVSAVVIVLLITRTSVQLHFPIVRLLHRIGAYDSYITHQFQINAVFLTLKGTIPGTIIASILFIIMMNLIGQYEISSMNGDDILTTSHIALFIIVPLLIVTCVYAAVQLSVSAMLHRLH